MKFVKFGHFIFLSFESACNLTDVPASIYDRKMDARPFDTTFYDVSVLCNLFSKAEMRQFDASGTDGLSKKFRFILMQFYYYTHVHTYVQMNFI